jgi:hypothetical protein
MAPFSSHPGYVCSYLLLFEVLVGTRVWTKPSFRALWHRRYGKGELICVLLEPFADMLFLGFVEGFQHWTCLGDWLVALGGMLLFLVLCLSTREKTTNRDGISPTI